MDPDEGSYGPSSFCNLSVVLMAHLSPGKGAVSSGVGVGEQGHWAQSLNPGSIINWVSSHTQVIALVGTPTRPM